MDETKEKTNLEAIFFGLGGTLIGISFDNFFPLYLLSYALADRHGYGNVKKLSEILGETRVF